MIHERLLKHRNDLFTLRVYPAFLPLSGQNRHNSKKIGVWLADDQPGFAILPDRVFQKEHAVIFGKPGKNLLWTLPDKIPTQMTVNDQWITFDIRSF